MYERILAALDGSETAQQALLHAIGLAKVHRAKLRLVHVVDELGVNLGETPTPDAFWQAARNAGERLLAEAGSRASEAGIDAETKLLEMRTFGALIRRVSDMIIDDAHKWPADVIVVGSHGRRGLSKLLLGSVAEGVIRMSPVSILLVRGEEASDSRSPDAVT